MWSPFLLGKSLLMSAVRPVASRVVARVPMSVGCSQGPVVCMHSPWMASLRHVLGGNLRCVRRLSSMRMFMLWRRLVMFYRPRSIKRVNNSWISCGWMQLCVACSRCCFGGGWCERAPFPCRLFGFPPGAVVSTWSRAAITYGVNRCCAGFSWCTRR